MNTTFKFTATKSVNKEAMYQVDLGVNVLDTISDEDRDSLATSAKKVEIQNHKGSLLRYSSNPEDAVKTLVDMGYTGATVVPYVGAPKKVLTVEDIRKAIAKGQMTKEQVEALLS